MKTKIEWTDATWNPVYGCRHDCFYCYAKKIAYRFREQLSNIFGIPAQVFKNFEPVWIERNFEKEFPENVSHIFVNSMSDIAFWQQNWVDKVIAKIKTYPEKKFMFLTKDLNSVYNLFKRFDNIPINCYVGATITSNSDLERMNNSSTYYDFLSIEPIHERINVSKIRRCSQIIVGAETGNRKERIIPESEWIEEIKIFCFDNRIRYFEKNSLKPVVNRKLIQERI